MSGTVEISQKQQEDAEFAAARHEEIAAICWKKCESCNGRGFHVEHWEAYDTEDAEYILKVECTHCTGEGEKQIKDPWRVTALYDAADDAREELGVWCYTRITKALALAVNGNVTLWARPSKNATVKSETGFHQFYTVTPQGCGCQDAYYRAPKINDVPRCKHQIAVWLVKAAEHKMFDQEPKHYGPGSDMLDGLISVQEAERREAEAGV